jgi:hypothetical protein
MIRRDGAPAGAAPWLARVITGSGVAGVVSGVGAWLLVRSQITDERIAVTKSASHFAGRPVTGPLTAYQQAEAIKRVALDETGGRTYGELPKDDPAAETALHASLLRASLFTSMLAFGVAALQTALGVVVIAVGASLRQLTRPGLS